MQNMTSSIRSLSSSFALQRTKRYDFLNRTLTCIPNALFPAVNHDHDDSASLTLPWKNNHGSVFLHNHHHRHDNRKHQAARMMMTRSRNLCSLKLPHDVGGNLSAYGPIKTKNEDILAWEQQCHSLFAVLASKRIISTDELRRAIEALTPEQYESWSYYEKWSGAMTSLLIEHNVISHDDISNVLFGVDVVQSNAGEVQQEQQERQPLFQVGDNVRVKQYHERKHDPHEPTRKTNVEWKRPHLRTPGYIYGVAGTIERVCGCHKDPSYLAFGLTAPKVQLYRVRFRQKDIWPEQFGNKSTTTTNNNSNSNNRHITDDDVIEVEIYEHWLEPSEHSSGHSYEDRLLFDHSNNGMDCLQENNNVPKDDNDKGKHPTSSHHHHHHHHHHHEHQPRPIVEERAIHLEGPPRPGKDLFQALHTLLIQKEIVSADEIRIMCERMDTAGKKLDGASLVVQAWIDSSFRERLLEDAVGTAQKEMNITTSNPNSPTVLTVLPNSPTVHNVIVCTLCSCYPSGLLGIAPSWYKSREYRSRVVREPRNVLREEFGLSIPPNKQIRVHDSTADHRYIVLPERPTGTENWSHDQLRQLVTRDTMIGVAIPSLSSSS